MIKKLLMAVFMIMIMAVSVSAFTVTNNDQTLERIGSGTVSGSVTIDEIDNTSTITGDTTLTFSDDGQGDDFNVTVTYNYGAVNEGSQTIDYSFSIPKDVAGTTSGILSFNDGSSTEQVNVAIDVSQLRLKDLDVKVGGDKDTNIQNEHDGYTIDAEAQPGDTITFTLKLENLFSGDDDDRNGNIEIEEVNVEIVIEGIDDDDDIEEDIDVDDIAEDDDESVTIEFEIPKKAVSDDYDVIITVEAEDENGNDFEFTKELRLEVEREKHKIAIDEASLTQSTLACDRTTTLKVDLINLGDKTEDEASVTIINSALGINLKESNLELDEDPNDDDNEMTLSFPISISENAIPGIYSIDIRSYYDGKHVSDAMKVELEVGKCAVSTPIEVVDEEPKEKEIVIVTQQPSEPVQKVVEETKAEPVITGSTPIIKESFTESVWFIVLLVLLNLAIIAIVIWLIAKFLTK